jgi:outer membrane protein insertion porin family
MPAFYSMQGPILLPSYAYLRAFLRSCAIRRSVWLSGIQWGLGLGLLFVATGCNPTRHLRDDQALLAAKPNFVGQQALDTDILYEGVKSRPNKRILWPRFYLALWNSGVALERDSTNVGRFLRRLFDRKGKQSAGFADLLKRNGEEPALVHHEQLTLDAYNLERIYFAHGYLNARVGYEVTYKKILPNRGWVNFFIQENAPYIIRSVKYVSSIDTLLTIVQADSASKLLLPGQLFDEGRITGERARIAELMRNHSYFRFDAGLVTFTVDTPGVWNSDTLRKLLGKPRSRELTRWNQFKTAQIVDVVVNLPDSVERYQFGEVTLSFQRSNSGLMADSAYHYFRGPSMTAGLRQQWRIPKRRLAQDAPFTYRMEYGMESWLNYNLLARRVNTYEGGEYRQYQTRDAFRELQNLAIFRSVTVRSQPNDSLRKVSMIIDMPLLPRYSFNVGFEAFQSEDRRLNTNLPGIGGKLNLQRRNAFRKAEQLGLDLGTTISFYQPVGQKTTALYFQVNARIYINVPRFVGLEKYVGRLRIFSPTTTFSLAFSQEVRLDFNRSTLTLDYRYQFLHNSPTSRFRSQFTPLSINIVNAQLSRGFYTTLFGRDVFLSDGSIDTSLTTREEQLLYFVRRDFQPRLNDKISYYFTFTDRYGVDRKRPSYYVKIGGELGGTVAYLVDLVTNAIRIGDGRADDGAVFKSLVYGQFVRLSFESRLFFPLGDRNDFVIRAYFGGSTGINKNRYLLLENRFYTGGVSSIRGWASNLLGPGVVPRDRLSNLPLGGEFILELNAELRTKIFGPIGTALFVDAGNVWFGTGGGNDLGDKDAELSLRTFQLGVSAGIGLRLDFSFILVRFDVAQQMYAPDIQSIVIKQFPRDVGGTRIQYNIGIGLPF